MVKLALANYDSSDHTRMPVVPLMSGAADAHFCTVLTDAAGKGSRALAGYRGVYIFDEMLIRSFRPTGVYWDLS